MSIHGVHIDDAAVDSGLLESLRTDDMERFRAAPATVMINRWQDDLDWLILDATYPAQIACRHRLLTDRYDMVIDRLPGDDVRSSERELCDTVIDYLLETYPDYFKRRSDLVWSLLTGITVDIGPDGADPLAAIALLASEDFLLLLPEVHEPDGERVYRLKAGALLFPNGWSLRSHFGVPLPAGDNAMARKRWEDARQASLKAARLGKQPYEIHNGHVAYYMEHFARRVDRFFAQMQPGMLAWRRNWSAKMSPALFLHSDAPPVPLPPSTPDNWAQHGYLRSEQQTFRKLRESGAVVFSIKTYLWRLNELVQCPVALHALIHANDHLPAGMVDYKGASLPSFREFLDGHRYHSRAQEDR